MLRREDGFTLPEMLIAMVIGLIVSLAAFSLIEFTMKRSGDVAARVETTQRARGAMDTITRELRSEVCLNPSTAPITAATPTSLTFYADFTDQANPDTPPELHTLTYTAITDTKDVDYPGRLTEAIYIGTSNHATPPTFTYPATGNPTRTRTLLTDVEPIPSMPVFGYYGFNTATPPATTLTLGSTVAAANLNRIARIEIGFRAWPSGRQVSNYKFAIQDRVTPRELDPNSFSQDDPTQPITANCPS
jgi:prepilin-type N-terminal cleavage/methylation domain-containing protein